jgi:hypothetical protein
MEYEEPLLEKSIFISGTLQGCLEEMAIGFYTGNRFTQVQAKNAGREIRPKRNAARTNFKPQPTL